MIDYFTLALTHGLIALALWRLIFRPELDNEGGTDRSERNPRFHKGTQEDLTTAETGTGDA